MIIVRKQVLRSTAFSILAVILLLSASVRYIDAAPPPINRPMEFGSVTDPGAAPETVDPAWCYDNPSGELIFNVYETLIFFNGERMDSYIPQLATEWTIKDISGSVSPEGLPWYYRYTFAIRSGVPFHYPDYGTLTPQDVEYSFERVMVMDREGGPAWTLYEPLLNGRDATYINDVTYTPATVMPDRVTVGAMIDHAIESNSTHVWFNIAFPGAYSPFLQILCQPWCSILSKAWANSLGRPIWDGNWGDYTGWWDYHNPDVAPLDNPDPVMMGTGPFCLTQLDYILQNWRINRFSDYWRGWPANWTTFGGSRPAGYVNEVVVSWGYQWMEQSARFLAGDIDFLAVPRVVKNQVLGMDGIRCYYPLPMLALDAILFNFNVNQTSPYGTIYPPGTFNENGMPADLFSDVHMRKAFAYLFDYATYISFHYGGEAIKPATTIIPALPYYDPTVTVTSTSLTVDSVSGTTAGYDYNLTKAIEELQAAWGGQLWMNGFTIPLCYNSGSWARRHIMEFVAQGIQQIQGTNPKLHTQVIGIETWPAYLGEMRQGNLPVFAMGWEADYPDQHDFAFPFYHTYGTLARFQGYSNPTMDALIELGIATPDGPIRAQIYHDIQVLALADCPNVPIVVPIGRHWERDWVVGWYWNPLYGGSLASGIESTSPVSNGLYFYNLWKWYYTPHAQQNTATQPTSNYLPFDVNYDGKTNMVDIGTTAASFGATYGPPMNPRWIYRCDFNNDRKIDMKDIGFVAKKFGKTSAVWTPT